MWWKNSAPRASSKLPARSALAVALEPRMMFDGAVAATTVETADAQPAADAADNQASTQDAPSSSDTLAATPAGTADNRQEVVFVDSQVKDYQQLVDGLKPGTEVVVLDAGKDGLQQMADYLDGRSGIDAIHVLSHGDVGKVQLGNDWLEGGDLAARSELLNAIGQSLSSEGDILLYGCQVGADGEGQAFIDGLAVATGADVAASSDMTGALSKGGDWVLESRSGLVETSAMGVAGYQHLLLAPADENYDDDPGQSFNNTAVFTLDGVKYTITGTAGSTYSSVVSNDAFSPLGNGLSDYYMLFDSAGLAGISSIKIEAADGSAFRLLGLSIDGLADEAISITPNGGSAVSFTSDGAFVTQENINLSANTQFHNITSFTISGGNLLLNLDDLNFDAPQVVPGLTSATVADTNLKAGETSLVTFTFNTAVSGFTTADLTVQNGVVSGLSSSDGGITWTGTLTPNSDVTDASNLITVNLAGVTSVSTGTAGSGTANSNNYAIDNQLPTVTSVSSSTANGTYKAGDVIAITVTFGESVTVTGTPQLTLETGSTDRVVNYASGSGTNTLTFNYTVQAGDTSADLDYIGSGALALNGGSIRDSAGNDATLTLASPGAAGSLGANKAIVINALPVLANLNGGSTHVEDGAATVIDADVSVSDVELDQQNGGNGNYDGASLVLVRNGGASAEDLFGFVDGNGITRSAGQLVKNGQVIATFVTSVPGQLTLTFSDAGGEIPTSADVDNVLRQITYATGSNVPPASVTLNWSFNDGSGGTASGSAVVTLTATNDAPGLAPANDTASYSENGTAAVLSPSLTISDPDSATFQGATVTLNDFRTGDVLSVGTPGGFSVSYDSSTGGLTLSGSGSLAALQTALQSVTYSSTSDDPTFGGTDGTRQINFTVTDGGGATSAAATSQVAITAVNDAPTLSGGPYVWAGTSEDATSSAVTVSSLLGGLTLADPDGPASGIALTAGSGNGTWQYSTDGIGWNTVGAVSGNAALLLSASSQLRYIPNAQNGETATLTFRAWDQTSGTASTNSTRNTADTTTNGGSTAFSSGTAQATLSVASVNDAPLLTPGAPSLTGLTDGDVNNPGQTVASFASASITDVDSGAVEGIAITGLSSGNGTWQYSLDGGASWQDVGNVAGSSALLLRSTDRVRFVPDGVNGTSASLTYRAWDQSGATAGQQGTKVDASATGGTTAFSSASDTAGITVSAVNDAPLVTTSGGSAAFVEGDNVASTPVVVDGGLTLSDSDSPLLSSATVAISGGFQGGQDVLAFTNDGATMGDIAGAYDSGTGVLTLTSAGGASIAQWQAALRSVTYSNSSDTPNTAQRTIGFAVDDGAATSSTANRTLTLSATNDAPVVTVPASISVVEDTATAVTGISFADADAGSGSVTVTLGVGSGSLAATSGGGVTVGGTATALTLTGSIANINAFIAGSNLGYTTVLNATGNVTLTASISDNGLSGGAPKSDSDSCTLTVTPVNDAPTITAPGSIAVNEDVATALTGISFADVDAGSGSVTATFSVASGALSATSGGGVSVAGSGSGSLTLSGSLADINAFIAASGVSFTTASNATANVTLTITLDDGGNTGGGSETDSSTLTLAVSAVNDAPVNSVPAAQNTDQDADLVFSSANGNLISISDVDAGGGTLRVTLTASNGLVTLSGTSGLSFLVGSGAGDGTMTFEGTVAAINLALNGLTFTPTAGYNGAASLQVVTNDLGLSGSGGNQIDSDTIAITVDPINPVVTDVSATTPDGGYKVGDVITLTVTFDQGVLVDTSGGVPTLLLETGLTDRAATYVSGSGSDTLTFSYTVQAGDLSADLDYQSTGGLALNGATIRSAGGDDAVLTLPGVGGANSIAGAHDILVDGVAPTVTSVVVPADGTYVAGQNLDFTVNLSEAVTVDTSGGTPRIAIALDGGGTVFANYLSGSGSTALVFRLTVASGQFDANGISVGSAIQANGAILRDAVGNDAITTLNNVGSTAGVNVDAVVPTVASVSVPAAVRYNAGDTLTFVVNTSEAVLVSGTPRLALDIGGSTVFANYVSGSGTSSLVFQYSVQPGDNDADGIVVASLASNGGTLRDAAGNDLSLSLNAVGDTSGVLVDTTAPAPSGIVTLDPSPTNAGSVRYSVTFSEDVSGVDLGDFSLVTTGTASGSLASLVQVDARTYTLTVNGLSGTGILGLDLNGAGTGIVDLAGNAISGGLAGAQYSLDRDAPTVTAVAVPADGTYVAGQHLDFTVNLSEAVTVDTSGGTPRLAITLDGGGTVFADYHGGSGSTALVFRLTVAAGQFDANGISVGSAIQANGGTLRDAVGNDVVTTLNGVGSTTGVRVDAVVPTVASVSVPAAVRYNAGDTLTFVVNTSEVVLVSGTPRLALDIGGTTVFANYVSGSGTSSLVFQYSVQPGDNDADGIAVASLASNGGTLRDVAGNDLSLSLNAVGDTSGVLVDTTAPAPSGIVTLDPSPTNAGSVRYSVTFSEDVSGVDLGDFSLVTTGTASGSLASLVQVDGRTYILTVNGISGTGTLGLDLNGAGSGIVDLAGNAITGGLVGAVYSLDRDVPTVTGVAVPADGTYVAGQHLDFTVNLSEAVTVDTSGGTPRLAITLDDGRTVFADYLGGSGSTALVFRLTVAAGQVDANGISVGSAILANGATLRDAVGNDADTRLNSVGTTAGVQVDAVAPSAVSLIRADTSPTSARTLHFTLTFSEDVSGLDLDYFSLNITGSAVGTLQSLAQVDARTYQVVVGNVAGNGSLGISLNSLGTGIMDAAGNVLTGSLVGESYVLGQSEGDPQFRVESPVRIPQIPNAPIDILLPGPPPPPFSSPLLPLPLFEVQTLGSGFPTLGSLFRHNGAVAPSFIAQVFAGGGVSGGDAADSGFLGFGGGDAGVFGTSGLASFFNRESGQGSGEMKLFDRNVWRGAADTGQGLPDSFGAPTLGQQLQDIRDNEQRQVDELARALRQIQADLPQG